MEKRFDNLTDEEIEEGMVNEEVYKSKSKKIKWIFIAIFLILILIIGYEIAPIAIPHGGRWVLSWLR